MGNLVIFRKGQRGELNLKSPMAINACRGGLLAEITENADEAFITYWRVDQPEAAARVDIPGDATMPIIEIRAIQALGSNAEFENVYLANFDLTEDQMKDGPLKTRLSQMLSDFFKHGVTVRSLSGRHFSNFCAAWQVGRVRTNVPEPINLATADLGKLYDDFVALLPEVDADEAFVTICSAGYEWGTIALIKSIRDIHDHPIFILCTSDTDVDLINSYGLAAIHVLTVANLFISDQGKLDARYLNTLVKFYIFAFDNVNRAVYLDSDMLILRPVNELLSARGSDMAPLSHDNDPRIKAMAVCTMSVSTGKEKFIALCQSAIANVGYSGRGDHGYFINYYGPDWDVISDSYNISHKVLVTDRDMIGSNPHCIHYHGFKPWSDPSGPGAHLATSAAHQCWYGTLRDDMLLDLTWQSRRSRLTRTLINYTK